MAAIYAVVKIDEPGVPEDTLRAMVESMKESVRRGGPGVDLESPVACQPVTILGVVKDAHVPLMPFFTGEVE